MVKIMFRQEQRKEKKQTNAQDAHEAIRPTSTLREPKSVKRISYQEINFDYIN